MSYFQIIKSTSKAKTGYEIIKDIYFNSSIFNSILSSIFFPTSEECKTVDFKKAI